MQRWQGQVQKLTKILVKFESKSSEKNIHISDLELLIHGLGQFPTKQRLLMISNQIRFGTSGDITETIDILNLCEILENHF